MHRALILLVAASLALGGCASIIRQELQSRVGPCRRAMVEWRERWGEPSDTESEEDDGFYTVTWIYPDRLANANARFEWEAGGDRCRVTRGVDRPF